MPHNRRSGNVLKRAGFVVEGYARDYLMINGKWEDPEMLNVVTKLYIFKYSSIIKGKNVNIS
jgi:ribosomal-protein-alanine N-acetyltransferase